MNWRGSRKGSGMNIDIFFGGVGERGLMLGKVRSEYTGALLLCPLLKRKRA